MEKKNKMFVVVAFEENNTELRLLFLFVGSRGRRMLQYRTSSVPNSCGFIKQLG